jgi:SET domain-containing protein
VVDLNLLREYIRGLLIEQGEKKPNWEIQKSPIHGVGVFAVSDIPANANLGAAQIKKVDGRYDVTDLGRHHNHSYDPTCYNKMKGNIRYLHPYNNMRSGDEITIDYTLQLDLEQPGPKWK